MRHERHIDFYCFTSQGFGIRIQMSRCLLNRQHGQRRHVAAYGGLKNALFQLRQQEPERQIRSEQDKRFDQRSGRVH